MSITSTAQHEETETGKAMASAIVDRAAQAVEQADARKTPPSAEVASEEQVTDADRKKAAKAAAKAVGAKPAKPAAEKKPSKYDDRIRAITKRAQELRTKRNAVAPITCQRVEALLKKEKTDAQAVVKMFATIKDAQAYAGGDKEVKTPDVLKALGEKTSDPFARGRGMTAICLAIREQK
jgi:hypothetical protein